VPEIVIAFIVVYTLKKHGGRIIDPENIRILNRGIQVDFQILVVDRARVQVQCVGGMARYKNRRSKCGTQNRRLAEAGRASHDRRQQSLSRGNMNIFIVTQVFHFISLPVNINGPLASINVNAFGLVAALTPQIS
jgi:hypothetical protein